MEILKIVGKEKSMGTLHGALHGEGTGSKGRLKQTILSALVAMFIMTGTAAGVAVAESRGVGGGFWTFGTTGTFGGGEVYSNYFHRRNCHTSSVIGEYYANSGPTAAGYRATASAEARTFKRDDSFWNNRC